MRNSIKILNGLSKHSPQVNYKYERLYRILFNQEMFFNAYQRIYAKPGNMTAGSDGKTIDGMSLERINKLIEVLRNETYQPQPVRRVYIPKKNGKMRPLGIPTFDDKLVQEVIRMILEAIYEGQFLDCSHGFRPKRSCHTALTKIQKTFTGAKWFIEGDIKGFFDGINHDILISILQERISDERFIRLIRKFLRAGYVEEWTFYKTYSGTPQGGIVSPILANIYLDKLDRYVKDYIKCFDKGIKKKPNEARLKLDTKKKMAMQKLKVVKNENERLCVVKQLKAIDKERLSITSNDEMDDSFKRMKYVRYADDFIIGVIGSKEDSKRIKEDIKNFLESKLKLELSEEKTLITHTQRAAKFLGYEILVNKSNLAKRDKMGRMIRSFNKKVYLKLSMDTIKKKLLDFGVLEIKMNKGKEVWKAREHRKSINNDDLEILQKFNYTLRGFHNYYAIANNSSLLHSFKYIMQYSMYRTFAGKYKTSVAKIAQKYKINGEFTISYLNRKSEVKTQTFYNENFKRRRPVENTQLDIKSIIYHANRTSLIDRLKAEKCEICGEQGALDMHHVRKLKNLDGKGYADKLMIARRRKTIALCRSCHQKTHAGKMD
ncbi:group II intron reverse transcriptase/maturase [Myroides odoratimimus]|uniref:Group II intron reverse transcriptase/maturase n=1 Tax=Myroides marinus TaxID=703342 RepID=A0A165QBD9_9FLAO|nr:MULTISPECIES: group II intron reverse transcriptase/maturase [Myroides]KUF45183.1 hypothetical protein AS361_15110 [Myroides marinus]KZE74344.1 group II intron reverse transcriptase/maturase [Myroides marinus]MDM1496727.1 group II intron reverse transcriptase/maturase [Myroides odoratimimus]MEC4084653.1 group II intron reverse transcriptase/maturase [Myroides odoratimimus]